MIKHSGTPAGPQTQSGEGADLSVLKAFLSGRSDVRKIHRVALIFSANTSETKFPSAPHAQNDFQASYSEVRKINSARFLFFFFSQRNVLIKLTPSKRFFSHIPGTHAVKSGRAEERWRIRTGSSELHSLWVRVSESAQHLTVTSFFVSVGQTKKIVQPLKVKVKVLFDCLLCTLL